MDFIFAPSIKRGEFDGSLIMRLPKEIDEGSSYTDPPNWATRLENGFWILPIKSLYFRRHNTDEYARDPSFIFEKEEGEWECQLYHPFEAYLPRQIKKHFVLRLELLKKYSASLKGWELILQELLQAQGQLRERILREWSWSSGAFNLVADNGPLITRLKLKKSIVKRLVGEIAKLGPYSFLILDALTYMFPEYIHTCNYLGEEDIKEMNKSCYYSQQEMKIK